MLIVTMSWESPGRFFLTTCSVTLPFFKSPSYSASFHFTTATLQRHSLHRFLSTSFKCHHGKLPSPAVSARLPLSAQHCFLLLPCFLVWSTFDMPYIHLEFTYRKKNINSLLNTKMPRLDNRVGFCEAMKSVCSHHDHHWHEGEGAVEERQSVCLRRGSQRVLESFSRAAQMSCDVSCATSQWSSSLSSSSSSLRVYYFAIPPLFFWQIFTHFVLIIPFSLITDHCQCLPLSLIH